MTRHTHHSVWRSFHMGVGQLGYFMKPDYASRPAWCTDLQTSATHAWLRAMSRLELLWSVGRRAVTIEHLSQQIFSFPLSSTSYIFYRLSVTMTVPNEALNTRSVCFVAFSHVCTLPKTIAVSGHVLTYDYCSSKGRSTTPILCQTLLQ